MKSKIHSQNLKRDIIVVHFVVTQGDVNIDSVEVFVLDQKFFVNLSGLFKMTS